MSTFVRGQDLDNFANAARKKENMSKRVPRQHKTTIAEMESKQKKESCPTLSKDNFCPHFDLFTFIYRKVVPSYLRTIFDRICSFTAINNRYTDQSCVNFCRTSVIFSRNSHPRAAVYLKIQHIYRLFDSLLVYMNIFAIIIMLSTHYGDCHSYYSETPFCIVCGMQYCYVLHEAASSYLAESTYPSESVHVKLEKRKAFMWEIHFTGEFFPP